MLSRRQINVQRENLAAMCRISVKSLLDYACLYSHVADDCEEFVNFCAVFEQMVSHRLRPYQKKVWLPGSQGSPRYFWEVLVDNYNRTRGFGFQTCIPNIEAIETIKSPKAKLRAFVRVALMEKRLSDYLYWLLDNSALIRESYLDGALLASDEAVVLCGDLIGLNAIDFNFCLKGNQNELLGPLEISYGPFLKYKQTSASRCSDEIEMLRLSGKDADDDIQAGSILTESNVNDILRLQHLEKDFRSIKEQKDYLEELVRLRDRQLGEANLRLENMRVGRQMVEREREKERTTMDACVLELQEEMTKLRRQNESLRAQVTSLKQFKLRMEMREVPMMDLAMGEEGEMDKPQIHVEMEQVDDRLDVSQTSVSMHMKKEMSPIPSDQRSIMSSVSDQLRLKEDSQSMVPLTGSLADVNVAMLDSSAKESSGEKTNVKKSHKRSVSEQRETEGLTDQTSSGATDVEKSLSDDQQQLASQETATSLGVEHEMGQPENQNNNARVEGIPDSSGIAESYILTGPVSGEMVGGDPLQVQNLASVPTVNVADENANAAAGLTVEEPHVIALSDGTGSGAESEKEDEVVTSDPELLNPSNSGSDGSDTAWDMLSDGEHNGDNKTESDH